MIEKGPVSNPNNKYNTHLSNPNKIRFNKELKKHLENVIQKKIDDERKQKEYRKILNLFYNRIY